MILAPILNLVIRQLIQCARLVANADDSNGVHRVLRFSTSMGPMLAMTKVTMMLAMGMMTSGRRIPTQRPKTATRMTKTTTLGTHCNRMARGNHKVEGQLEAIQEGGRGAEEGAQGVREGAHKGHDQNRTSKSMVRRQSHRQKKFPVRQLTGPSRMYGKHMADGPANDKLALVAASTVSCTVFPEPLTLLATARNAASPSSV